jgi:hypothetical protein
MVIDVSRGVFAGVVLGIAAAVAASAGCSSSSAGTGAPSGPQSHACPATIDDTVNKPCSVQGQICGPTYDCGTTQVPITCTCTDGTFQCIDGAGNAFDNSSPPSCTTPPGGGTCPPDENTANRAACKLSQVGQQCAYAPQCPGGTQAYDVCTCTSGATKTGGQGLVFICENSCSGGTGPVPEAGPQPEAGPPADTGTPDAGPPDASAD